MFRQTVAVLAVLIAGALPIASHAAPAQPPIFGAYYPGGSAARYPVSSIPAERLTHLFYAFSTIEDGRCTVGAEAPKNFAALAELKKAHPHLRTLISIGGWGAGGFSDAALTEASRKRLVDSCMALFFDRHAGSFDGVDIDWEFPVSGGPKELAHRPQDRANLTRLAQAFRVALDAHGRKERQPMLLTAALAAGRLQTDGPYDPAASYDLPALAKVFDFINLMSYDMGTGSRRCRPSMRRCMKCRPIRWPRSCGAGTTWPARCSTTASTACRPINWCWAYRSTGAASRSPAMPRMGCTSPTVRRPMPATGG